MSIDLNFWKYQDGTYLDNVAVYRSACCDQEEVEGLALLPIEDILSEMAAAFQDWNALDVFNYEKKDGSGSFQISTTPQTVRFDCYSMERADMKRFSTVMSKFGCPLYDPGQGVRFDKIAVLLVDEAGEYKMQVERAFARLLPRMETAAQVVTWEEYVRLSRELDQIKYNAVIHRAKTMTKVTSFMQFGNAWANRPCQCKTAKLADQETAASVLKELLIKSLERVVADFLERTYYE
jgi:hypothetical protein